MTHPSSPGTLARVVLRGLAGASIVLACTAAAPPRPTPAASSPPPLVVAPVHIHGMSYDRARHSLVLTITGPVTISTRALKAPPRLVVDIPSASLDSANREMVVKDELVQRVRVSQWKIFPPVVRVVIETATEAEPLIAVQQTGKKLYVTLAPARPSEEPTPEGVLPSPGPEPSSFTPPTLPEGPSMPMATAAPTAPAGTPDRGEATAPPVRTTPTPAPRWTPAARWTPTPRFWSPAPASRPGMNTRLRPNMPIPTPLLRRSPTLAPGTVRPGTEWREIFPAPTPKPSVRPTPAPGPATPRPMSTPFPLYPASPAPDQEPTPVPPPRGTEEGIETLPVVP